MLGFLFIMSVLLGYAVTKLTIVISLRRSVLDLPNERSSHSQPVPRMGGLGIFAGFVLALVILGFMRGLGFISYPVYTRDVMIGLFAGTGMAATGLYDDLYRLNPAAKFLWQFMIASVVVVLGIHFKDLALLHWGPIPLRMLSFPLTVLWLTGFANIFNFMDGINGLAAVTGAAYGGFFLAFAWQQGSPEFAALAVLLIGSCLGFLFHNFPRAKTFMGDTGSLFLGIILSIFVVRLSQQSPNPASLMGLLLVCSVYLWDSGFTLLRRLWRRENIFEAHRSHLYQRLAQLGLSHVKITGMYLLLHILMGSLGYTYVWHRHDLRPAILAIAFFILLGFTLSVYRFEDRAARAKLETAGKVLGSANP